MRMRRIRDPLRKTSAEWRIRLLFMKIKANAE